MESKTTVKGKTAFYLFLLTISVVIIAVWLTGLNIHRTIFNNALFSLTIITIFFFSFVTCGLYMGIGLTDNFGNIKNRIGFIEPSGISGDLPGLDLSAGEFASEGIEGIVLGIFIWIGVFILTVTLIFFFETIVFAALVIFTGALYWVFYRAMRLILRYSKFTKGELYKSMGISLTYSLLYSGWIYGIILLSHYIKK